MGCLAALAEAPKLNRTQPLALLPGQTAQLVLIGERLASEGTLWTSFTAQITPVGVTDAGRQFSIALATNLPTGIGAIRFANSNGISDLQLILIDPLKSITGVAGNTNVATAQALTPPAAVDGHCNELESRYYRVELRGRQRVFVEVIANRLGSALDPSLRVLDSRGRELVNADDTPGCGSDARLEFVAPKAGSYFIEIRDTRYSGGPDFFHRLRVAESGIGSLRFLPLAGSTQPVASAWPVVREKELDTGPAIERGRKHRGKGGPDPASDRVGDASKTPMVIRPPVQIRGRFDSPNDRDVYEFTASKDERWIVRGRTRSIGSPCDLHLRLEKPDGTLIAEADATGAGEGSLTNKFSEAGLVRLVVEELNHEGGAAFDYELHIVPFEPGFTLTATANTLEAVAGGTFQFAVQVARQDFPGPITLSIVGSGEGFTLTNNVIAEKQTTNTMTVTVPPGFGSRGLTTFSVVGSGDLEGRQILSRASTMPSLKAQLPGMLYPPRELDGLIWFGVNPARSP